jgi:hypothetical protein
VPKTPESAAPCNHFIDHLIADYLNMPNFDILSKLYQENPLAFEALRRQLLTDAIAAAPAHHRPALQQTLDRIDRTHRSAATPQDAAAAAFRLMDESLSQLQDGWSQLQYDIAGLQTALVLERARK